MKSKMIAEFFGTAFLVMIVIGSGIMGQNLFPGQDGLALLVNSLATGAGLFVLIQCLGSLSGAHFNPIVSLVEVLWGRITIKIALAYIIAQMTGAYLGIVLTHSMFNHTVFQIFFCRKGRISFMDFRSYRHLRINLCCGTCWKKTC